jgi:hypothetical protein
MELETKAKGIQGVEFVEKGTVVPSIVCISMDTS